MKFLNSEIYQQRKELNEPLPFVLLDETNNTDKTPTIINNEIEKIIQKNLNKVLDADNLLILAGSGSSLHFGNKAPSMKTLWRKCAKNVANIKIKDIKNFTNYVEIKKANKIKGNNIELLLSCCDNFLSMNPEINSKNDKGNNDKIQKVKNFLDNSKRTILKETNFISELEPNNDDWRSHNSFVRTLGLRNKNKQRLKIFTTNYDLAFEQAASNVGMIVIDGFEFSKPHRFNSALYNYDIVNRNTTLEGSNYIPNVIHLYKLHGSVDWIRYPNNDIIYKGNPLDESNKHEPVFIYPSITKYQLSYDSPYVYLISTFVHELKKPKTALICVGFGFNDKHLNNAILMALRTNPELLLVISTLD
ncbi:SIR2 family protein, partial [Psittacicella gerlachiana]